MKNHTIDLSPADERRGLIAWRKRIDERLRELDEAEREAEDIRISARRGDPQFAQWERARREGAR